MDKMSSREVAYYLDCMPENVMVFARIGVLPGIRKGPKGRWRWEFKLEDVKAFRKKYGDLNYDDLVNELKYKRILNNKEIMRLTSGRMSAQDRKKADKMIKEIKSKLCEEFKKGV